MAVRGVYTKDEETMIANFNKQADSMVGWAKRLNRKLVTEESIKNTAIAYDYWNPLWRDSNYAMNTRWGDIIAPPLYQDSIAGFHFGLVAPPSAGFELQLYIGEDWKLYQPVRVGDSFKVWRRRSKLEDITGLDDRGPRKFKLMPHDMDHINQRNELVSTMKLYVEYTYFPDPPKKLEYMPEYQYTRQELDYIYQTEDQEEIRGADIRYWEDVTVGEDTRPVVFGPTTLWDLTNQPMGARPPLREMRRMAPGSMVIDPVTGVAHGDSEKHLSDRIAQLCGNPRAFHSGGLARQLMARLVTNWMGDDGFIRAFKWRHMVRSAIGDTYFGKGKVVGKRIDNGVYLVDLKIWLENIRGHVTEAAVAVVSLYSRENPYQWK